MRKGLFYILFIFLVACSTRGCVESEFNLSKESRLPAWFKIPNGMKRSDLDVTLTYYTTGPADLTLIDIRNRNKKSIKTIKVKNIHHPEYWAWADKDWPKRAHPGYVILSSNNITEIIVHKERNPVFHISNESAVQNTIHGKKAYNKALNRTD